MSNNGFQFCMCRPSCSATVVIVTRISRFNCTVFEWSCRTAVPVILRITLQLSYLLGAQNAKKRNSIGVLLKLCSSQCYTPLNLSRCFVTLKRSPISNSLLWDVLTMYHGRIKLGRSSTHVECQVQTRLQCVLRHVHAMLCQWHAGLWLQASQGSRPQLDSGVAAKYVVHKLRHFKPRVVNSISLL